MDNRDVLLQICAWCDDKTLEKLCLSGLWNVIVTFVDSPYFWYLITSNRCGVILSFNPVKCYRRTYVLLSCMKEGRWTYERCEEEREERERSLQEAHRLTLRSMYL